MDANSQNRAPPACHPSAIRASIASKQGRFLTHELRRKTENLRESREAYKIFAPGIPYTSHLSRTNQYTRKLETPGAQTDDICLPEIYTPQCQGSGLIFPAALPDTLRRKIKCDFRPERLYASAEGEHLNAAPKSSMRRAYNPLSYTFPGATQRKSLGL